MTAVQIAPLRRLPITLAPVHRETIASFIGCLATVNHLDADDLADTVAAVRWKSMAVVKRIFSVANLASVTGHSTDALTRALPELSDPSRRFPAHRVVQACPRCCRRHRGGLVRIHPQPHQHVCVPHNIWLGSLGPESSGWIKNAGPVDVSGLPVIRAAQRRHHRLVRHHGADAARSAVCAAVDTWERSNGFDQLGFLQWERLRVLRPGANSVSLNDPVAAVVCYPEIITIPCWPRPTGRPSPRLLRPPTARPSPRSPAASGRAERSTATSGRPTATPCATGPITFSTRNAAESTPRTRRDTPPNRREARPGYDVSPGFVDVRPPRRGLGAGHVGQI
jgi:hypothetical protein